MNIHKLVHNSQSPGFELDYSRLGNSRLHNYSKSQNLTSVRPKQTDRSLKGSFKENQQSMYRISSLLVPQNTVKPQRVPIQGPRLEKSLALFCSNRERSRSRHESSVVGPVRRLEMPRPVPKKPQVVLQRKKSRGEKGEDTAVEPPPRTVSTLPHRG